MTGKEPIMKAQSTFSINITVPASGCGGMKMKGNLISLTGMIFILLASMAMTGCAITGTPLATAAYKGRTDVVKELLDKGADANERSGCGLGWDPNVTALTCAAHGGHMESVKVLVGRGADVNARSRDGWTPLISAAYAGNADIAKLLIEKGADIDSAMAFLEKWGLGKDGFRLLEKLAKKQQPAMQPETLASKPFQEVSPAIKSDVNELPAIKAKPDKNAYAIVVGIEQYRQKLPKADFAVADAKSVSDYLTRVMGYPEENVVTLLNDRAALGDFVKYFEKWLPNNVEKDGTVFVYYSGHGAPDSKTGGAYLVPYDGDPTFIAETGYSLKRMYDALGKLPAKEIIVALDSCFSGAGGRSVIAKGARPLVMNLQTAIAPAKNMTVLAASSGEQTSSTYDEKGHGLFTYFMLNGIKNEDIVKPDGSLEIRDLYNYIKPQVENIARRKYNNEQTPQLIEGKGN
ncbi:MAG: hypothetical protein A2X56_13405 [Nitrospirae bacterium GWC2_57_13]|nr:MAG: hypothetical protein A2072_08895 [Nitrospirae bacterium GWC1_57_7]OGW27017.1 MAG: hypothetical protein A2X56_13405 [Nitrospirae bacterium GWC2_57_13]OGW42595.1 MAG: hypothetical protein A2X57_11845 [Nitrospirae bacterium GWD2_57_8]